jgi:hypothetical protein
MSQPFPKVLHWALVAAFSTFGFGMAVALITGTELRDVVVLLYLVGALLSLFALPVAVFLLVRNPYYINRVNVAITILAALPFLALMLVIIVFASKPHFHI